MEWQRAGWLFLTLVGCTPGADPAPGDTEAGLGTSSTDHGGSGSSTALEGSSTGEDPWAAPDCEALSLPGDPDDVAATPRADRDAEELALALSGALVAETPLYEAIAADLDTMRTAEPLLADVHVRCGAPQGFSVWTYSPDLPGGATVGTYRAWDCHNAYYGVTEVRRIDGVAFLFASDGVFSAALADEYKALPGFEEASIVAYYDDPYETTCTPSTQIELETARPWGGSLGDRVYRWTLADGDIIVFEAVGGSAPTRVD